MTKLSPAQDKAIRAFGAAGDFPKGTREVTIKAIESAGLIFHWNGDDSYDLTPDGRAYLGIPTTPNTATVDEVLAELDTNPWDNVTEHASIDDALDDIDSEKWSRTKNAIADLASQVSKNLERPFVVREWVATRWVVIPDTRSITWGTANVKRNRLKSQGRTVHVLNIQTQEVWA